jgi:histidine triad (HIT) family protein
MDCLFCKIIDHSIKSNIIYEDETLLAFDDIRPQAPQHKLIIPKRHIETINELTEDDANLVGQMVLTAKQIAKDLGIDQDGFRLVFNCNRHGGQEVYHIHLHLLGGRQMHWPPG